MRFKLLKRGGERIRDLRFPVNEPPDPAHHRDQEPTVIALSQSLNAVRLVWQRVQFGGAWLPMPDAGIASRPDIPRSVLIEPPHCIADPVLLSVATNAAIAKYAEPPNGALHRADPYRAVAIFKK